MAKKKDITAGAEDAEVVATSNVTSITRLPLDKPDQTESAEDLAHKEAKKIKEEADKQQVENLKAELGALLKSHQENATLAFELLKSTIAQKSETVIHGTAFPKLVSQIFALTDAFKKEVDRRYTDATNEAIARTQPSDTSTESSATVN